MKNQTKFSEQLIKGKITELIFEQMLREAGGFTVLAFGYENILPELMHQQHDMKTEKTMEVIRRAPDFAVINNNTHDVHLIEVKYRKQMRASEILSLANRMYESWKPSHLFLATPTCFYFDKVADIIEKKGKIQPLVHPQIGKSLQERYIKLLNEFINQKSK
jgi:hypothetical protein